MKTKIPVFILFLALSLVTVNLLLWHWDKEAESTDNLSNQASSSVTETESTDSNFSVEKLNNQASVKQLRKALFKKDEEVEASAVEAENRAESELTADIERLSREIATLKESL